MVEELEEMKKKIINFLNKSGNISLTTDIATTKGMTGSYLGIIAHVWEKNRIFSIAIDLISMNEKHTAQNIRAIVDAVIADFKIESNKIFRIITDSGANVKAAFV